MHEAEGQIRKQRIDTRLRGLNLQNVLEQAKRYACGASHSAGDWHGFRVRFLRTSESTGDPGGGRRHRVLGVWELSL